MLVVMVGLLSGGLWWEGWGRPGAAQRSPEQPTRAQESRGELWSTSGGAQGDPEHLHYDTFPGDSGSQVCPCPCKPPLGRPEAGARPRYAFKFFLSRQRADFDDLGCPRAWGDEVCKGKPANQSRQEKCHSGGVLGHPGLAQKCSRALPALLGSPGLLLAAAGCSWSAPALPPESPREQTKHDNQQGPTLQHPSASQGIL